jgi:hypothetical protein
MSAKSAPSTMIHADKQTKLFFVYYNRRRMQALTWPVYRIIRCQIQQQKIVQAKIIESHSNFLLIFKIGLVLTDPTQKLRHSVIDFFSEYIA